jgi:hypothetical protein
VVVLHEHRGTLGRLLDDGVGELAVVAAEAGPRLVPVPIEPGPTGQVEQVVVTEPERSVGDDLVGHLEHRGLGFDRDDHDAVRLHQAFLRRHPVGFPEGRRDPASHRIRRGAVAACRRARRSRWRPPVGRPRNGTTPVPGWRPPRCRSSHPTLLVPCPGQGGQTGGMSVMPARPSAVRNTSSAWGRSSASGRLRCTRTPRSTCAIDSAPKSRATSMSRPISTP